VPYGGGIAQSFHNHPPVECIVGQLIKYVLGYDHALGFVRLFYVDAEGNIPSFFSAMLLFLASLLLAFITVLKRSTGDSYRYHWGMLALLLLFMAVDEAVGLHEMSNRAGWSIAGHQGIFHYGWVIFGIALTGVVTLAFLKFFLSLPPLTQVQFFRAAAVFMGGALGMEILGGYYAGSHGGEQSFQFSMFVTVEEGLEMVGVVVFINALLTYLAHHHEAVLFRFSERTGPPAGVLSLNKRRDGLLASGEPH
jgi:hypothetical protein